MGDAQFFLSEISTLTKIKIEKDELLGSTKKKLPNSSDVPIKYIMYLYKPTKLKSSDALRS